MFSFRFGLAFRQRDFERRDQNRPRAARFDYLVDVAALGRVVGVREPLLVVGDQLGAASLRVRRLLELLARIEIDVTEPSRVVAIVTRESVDELGLKAGMSAAGVVKSTSVMVER